MSIESQIEREEQALEDDLNNGHLTMAQYNKEMQDLARSYRYEAEEAAQGAYDNEMSNW